METPFLKGTNRWDYCLQWLKPSKCSFCISPEGKGFDRIKKKVQEEKATLGQKGYFTAVFGKLQHFSILYYIRAMVSSHILFICS